LALFEATICSAVIMKFSRFERVSGTALELAGGPIQHVAVQHD
jgi:hypothetical protein